MIKYFLALLIFVFADIFCNAQQFITTSYRDTALPYVELNPSHYNFDYPVLSDILDSAHFNPPTDGVYLKGGFGHRYLSSRTYKSDNHGGYDYWDDQIHNGIVYNSTNRVNIVSMCDGYISQVIDGPDSVVNATSIGRSVRVTCDSSFQSFGFKIKINYRHLNHVGSLARKADTAAFGSIRINKGDSIGQMGKSGTTNNVHLHMSTQTIHPNYGNAIVNTTRLFDPTKSPGVLTFLTDAKIKLLQDWTDSSLFRISWQFNQTINRFEFINGTDTILFDKEEAYNTGSSARDLYSCIPDVDVFAYQFNGKQTARARYLTEMVNLPSEYPASPNRDTNLTLYGYSHFPIMHDSVAYVYDFVLKNISPSHSADSFVVKLSDVWGSTVEGKFPTTVNLEESNSILVTISPNPVSEKLNLRFNKSGVNNIKLFNLNGIMILEKSCTENQLILELGFLSKGMYFLKAESEGEVQTIKLVKQ